MLGQLLQSLRKNEEGRKAQDPMVLVIVPDLDPNRRDKYNFNKE